MKKSTLELLKSITNYLLLTLMHCLMIKKSIFYTAELQSKMSK